MGFNRPNGAHQPILQERDGLKQANAEGSKHSGAQAAAHAQSVRLPESVAPDISIVSVTLPQRPSERTIGFKSHGLDDELLYFARIH